MNEFFNVMDLPSVLAMKRQFAPVSTEAVDLAHALDRTLGEDLKAPDNIPGFDRATMDGFAVQAASTFGASEGNPAYLEVVGAVQMGTAPKVAVGPGQAVRIATGGMLPPGADSVLMVEHSDTIDATTIEAYRSLAPGQNMVARDEDVAAGQELLSKGRRLRAQEIGLLAASGCRQLNVFRRPTVGIISSGDEVIPMESDPTPGQIRDINSHTLAALVRQAGARPVLYGIVGDQYDDLSATCTTAIADCDMVLVSGGSSVGMRDWTLKVLEAMRESRILVHGISIRPGKPTILARCGGKAFWGLPGHVVSAMVVFMVVVRPFLDRIGGRLPKADVRITARLSRNLASVQGRMDFVRVRLTWEDGVPVAEPILGQSGLIHTMVEADGLLAIDMNSEGLDRGAQVEVMLI